MNENTQDTPPLVIISGLSGSGKSIALKALEDVGFYCIDNLPVALLPHFAAQLDHYPRAAVGLDVRSGGKRLEDLRQWLQPLRLQAPSLQLIFLTAHTNRLVQRFSETRRRHPLADQLSLSEAIAEEQRLLKPLHAQADWIIDTSDCNIHELRHRLWKILDRDAAGPLVLKSFAFRNGLPGDLDLLFDARCLPNPHWQADLRPFTGLNQEIQNYLDAQDLARELVDDIDGLLQRWAPRFQHQQRGQVTVGVGCTGGRHRSVYIVERLADRLRDRRSAVIVHHRELT